MNTKHTALVAALISCGAFVAPAQAQWEPDFRFSGFGTLGVARTNSDTVNFGRDRQSYGGATKNASVDVDSNLGLQATGEVNKWLSGTVQVLTVKRTTDDHLTTEAEWAFVKVAPVEGLSLRGGRLAVPMFLVSDSRNVGYANNWLRAPNEVYGLVSFRRLQGFDVTYQHAIGSTTLTLNALTGTSVTKYGLTLIPMKDVKGINAQLETEWATFRLGKVEAKYATTGQGYAFTGFGVTVDRNNIFMQAEIVRKRAPLVPFAEANGQYIMAGYRFGTLLPYAMYASTKPKAVLANNTSGSQSTDSLGLRWDAFKTASLKFQLDRTDAKGTKGISFYNAASTTAIAVTSPVTVISAAVDFVF